MPQQISPMVIIHNGKKLYAAIPAKDGKGFEFVGDAYYKNGQFFMKAAPGLGQDTPITVSRGFESVNLNGQQTLVDRALPGVRPTQPFTAIHQDGKYLAATPKADGTFDIQGEVTYDNGQFHLKGLPGMDSPTVKVDKVFETVIENGKTGLEARPLPQGYSYNPNSPATSSGTTMQMEYQSKTTPQPQPPHAYTAKEMSNGQRVLVDSNGNTAQIPPGGKFIVRDGNTQVYQAPDGSVWTQDDALNVTRYNNAADLENHLNVRLPASTTESFSAGNAGQQSSAPWDGVSPIYDEAGNNIIGYKGWRSDGESANFRTQQEAGNYVQAHQNAQNFGTLTSQEGGLTFNNGTKTMWRMDDGTYSTYDWKTGKGVDGLTQDQAMAAAGVDKGGSGGSSGSGSQESAPKGDFLQRLMNNPAVAAPLAIMGGYGLYKGFEALGQQFSAMGLVNSAMGALTFASSAGNLLNRLKFLNGNGGAYALAAIAVIAAIGYLMGRKKKGNELDTTKGDVAGMANTGAQARAASGSSNTNVQQMQVKPDTTPKPWYKQLSSNNVFMITSAAALMAIGLNLGLNGPSSESKLVKATELAGVRNAIDSSIGGGKLAKIDTSVLGKVFVQSSDNNGLTPDKVVYVSQETTGDGKNPPEFSVNMVSLNYQGGVVSPNLPNLSYIPMFYKNENGAVVAVPQANAAMARERALASAAASNTTSPTGAIRAVLVSGGNHN